MSKSPTPSKLFPQVSRGESNDAAKGLLDDAGDSSGDEAHYAPRGDYAPPRPVTSPPVGREEGPLSGTRRRR